ncbi:MAG: alpha/beta fold hydrolase [Acidimicrobiales bacterium]
MSTSSEIDLNGPVHVVDHGGEGIPILLVHGLGGSHVNWSAVADRMTEFGSVRAIDLIGFGYTPPAGRSSSVESQVEMIVSYLREYTDRPAVLVGNSMGGLTSMLVAEAAPDLVDSLVLVDPALPVIRPRLDTEVLAKLALPLIPGYGKKAYAAAAEDPEAFLDSTLSIVAADPSKLRAEDREVALVVARDRAEMPWVASAFGDSARSIFRIGARRMSFAKRAAAIRAPALVIHGEQDRLVDVASARWLVKQRPGWELVVLEGIGHVPQLEAPDRFLELAGAWMAERSADSPVS